MKIMLVDDSKVMRRIQITALNEMGYETLQGFLSSN